MAIVLVSLLGFLGLIVTAIVGPHILAKQLNKQRADAQAEEWKRQDVLADRADAAAASIVQTNHQSTDAVLASGKVLIGKVETVHKLVNSNLTASKESTLAAKQQTLAVLRMHPTPDGAAIAEVEAEVRALMAELADRKLQDAAVRPGIEQTAHDEEALDALPTRAAPPPAAPVVLPAVVSTDPDAVGVPVVIEGTMTNPPPATS